MARLRSLASGDLGSLLTKMPPQTRFSADVSAHRVFEAVGLPLAEFKQVRAHVADVTINDMFLCIVGGALRALPEEQARTAGSLDGGHGADDAARRGKGR